MADTGQHNARRKDSWRLVPWAIAAFLLLLPLAAMQFSDEVIWDETDFIVMGVLLFGACGTFEAAARMSRNIAYRTAVGLAVAAALALIWINLAVGIIGSEDNPANLMYIGVLAVGVGGAFLVRLRPQGMAGVLVAMALAQVLAALLAVVFGWGSEGENWPQVIVVLNRFFAALWLGSAGLFRKAGQEQPASLRELR